MPFESFIAFNIALLAALASPGPAFLMAVRTTLVQGRAAGIAMGCGLATMASVWLLLAVLGLAGIFHIFPWVYAAAKIAGASYLLYLAWRTWGSATTPVSDTSKPRPRAFRTGLLVNLSNPKSVLFGAAVLLVIFPADMTATAKALVVVNQLVVETLFYSLLALVLGTAPARRRYLAAKRHLDRFAAAVMGALGLRLLLTR